MVLACAKNTAKDLIGDRQSMPYRRAHYFNPERFATSSVRWISTIALEASHRETDF